MNVPFTQLPNDLLDHLCRVDLSPHESRLLWLIIRRTLGFHRPIEKISFTQFSKGTGIDRWRVWRSLRRLEKRGIIVARPGDRSRISYRVQKDFSKWKLSPVQATLSRDTKGIARNGDSPSPKRATNAVAHTGDTLKESLKIELKESTPPIPMEGKGRASGSLYGEFLERRARGMTKARTPMEFLATQGVTVTDVLRVFPGSKVVAKRKSGEEAR